MYASFSSREMIGLRCMSSENARGSTSRSERRGCGVLGAVSDRRDDTRPDRGSVEKSRPVSMLCGVRDRPVDIGEVGTDLDAGEWWAVVAGWEKYRLMPAAGGACCLAPCCFWICANHCAKVLGGFTDFFVGDLFSSVDMSQVQKYYHNSKQGSPCTRSHSEPHSAHIIAK